MLVLQALQLWLMCRMCHMQVLGLHDNKIGNDGCTALAKAAAGGALASVTYLSLSANEIGDEGMIKFLEALVGGALASLKTLCVDDGPLGTEHPALNAACAARRIRLT
jgi:hypothetical protein